MEHMGDQTGGIIKEMEWGPENMGEEGDNEPI